MQTTKTAICHCQHCSQKIEFDAEHAGEMISCPNCGMETVLFVPTKPKELPKPQKIEPNPHPQPKEPTKPRSDIDVVQSAPNLTLCSDCMQPISGSAVLCPHCGTIPSLARVAFYIILVSFLISIFAGGAIMLLAAVVSAFNGGSR